MSLSGDSNPLYVIDIISKIDIFNVIQIICLITNTKSIWEQYLTHLIKNEPLLKILIWNLLKNIIYYIEINTLKNINLGEAPENKFPQMTGDLVGNIFQYPSQPPFIL